MRDPAKVWRERGVVCPGCEREFYTEAEVTLHSNPDGTCKTWQQLNEANIWRTYWGVWVMMYLFPDQAVPYLEQQNDRPEPVDDIDDLI